MSLAQAMADKPFYRAPRDQGSRRIMNHDPICARCLGKLKARKDRVTTLGTAYSNDPQSLVTCCKALFNKALTLLVCGRQHNPNHAQSLDCKQGTKGAHDNGFTAQFVILLGLGSRASAWIKPLTKTGRWYNSMNVCPRLMMV
jgi:hypothetical protein